MFKNWVGRLINIKMSTHHKLIYIVNEKSKQNLSMIFMKFDNMSLKFNGRLEGQEKQDIFEV